MPAWEEDIKTHQTTNLKLPGIRKLHIFKWLLPHCKNWREYMKDHTFDVYFPKLEHLEEQNLKRQKIEPVVFKPTNVLLHSVLDVLCDVYRKVVYVTRVMPYMYTEECIEFWSDFVEHLLGIVRVVAQEEQMHQMKTSTCIEVDMFYLHLSLVLAPVAREQTFCVSEVDVKCDAMKTISGGRSLTLLNRMAHLTERWATNMGVVVSLMEATVALDACIPFVIAYDEAEEVITPREGFDEQLYEAVHKAVTDKPVLQHGMAALCREFCQTKCTFGKSVVSWVKRAVALKERKNTHLPGFVSWRKELQAMQVE